jgi:mRNA interferase MazF
MTAPGEIHLARFPMGGRGGVKLRPVLLLTAPVGPVPELLSAYISTVIPPVLLPSDLLLDASQPEFASTNLTQVSVLRLHKLATIHRRDAVRQLGVLSTPAMQQVQTQLWALLNL